MSNIVGEGFPDFTIEQIKQRQRIYGSINRTNEQLTYLNGRTGWCKLVSSVNIITPLRGINITGNKLAKEFVLFNGITNEDTNTQRGGIWPGTGNYNSYAYGGGGTSYGFRPMPGIKSASTKTETRGSLKTSTIQIQANNKEQFDIIDTLYLRLGFTMLLEWGNSSYFNNDGTYMADNPNSLADEFLLGTLDYKNYSEEINKKRKESKGNYDAVVGKVVNFNWTFTKDGTYEITVTLRSMGDVIESLKSNILLPGKDIFIPEKVVEQQQDIKDEKAELTQDQKDLEAGKAKVAVIDAEIAAAEKILADEKAALEANNGFTNPGDEITIAARIGALALGILSLKTEREAANFIYVKLNKDSVDRGKKDVKEAEAELEKVKAEAAKTENEEISKAKEMLSDPDAKPEDVIKAFSKAHQIGRYFYQQQQILSQFTSNGSTGISLDPTPPINFFSQQYEGDNSTIQYYIRLGHFLEWIQDKLIPKVKKTSTPLIKIYTDPEKNIIYTLHNQISSDPGICTFNTEILFKNSTIQFAPGTEKFIEVLQDKSKNKYGKIMNSYFNMIYILTQLDSLKDKDGIVPIFDLIQSLCDGWNKATGNFNKLSPSIDSDENEMKIIDEVSLPDRDDWLKKFEQKTDLTSFDVYGYYYPKLGSNESTGASFIRDIKFNTTIPPNLATMITIGATSNGYVVGQDATNLSAMNAGLEDRFKEEITLGESINPASTASLNQDYIDSLTAFNVFTSELGHTKGISNLPKWNKEAISAFNTTAAQFYEYDQAKQTLAKNGEKYSSRVALGYETSSLTPLIKKSSPNGGFLPFDLSLTMDGLSGMKVYQRYIIDTEYLPSNYPNSLEFLIKGINNTIQNNEWITTIESFAIPKNPFGSSISKSPTSAASNPSNRGTQNFSTRSGGTSRTIEGVKYKNGEIPENKLRVINNASKYKGAITSDGGRIRLYEKASLALDKLIVAAEQAKIPVKINSGYRTYDDQVRVRAQYPNDSAKPGTSNHGFGLAVDFATPSPYRRIKQGDKLYDWLVAGNGAKFGFKRIASETWHWEYQI